MNTNFCESTNAYFKNWAKLSAKSERRRQPRKRPARPIWVVGVRHQHSSRESPQARPVPRAPPSGPYVPRAPPLGAGLWRHRPRRAAETGSGTKTKERQLGAGLLSASLQGTSGPCPLGAKSCPTMSNMEKHLFNLKFAAKELSRSAKKCDKEEKAEKAKIKKAIQKGNMEVARIHAENAIRQKNQAVNFLRMSARVDAVAARVQTAVTMGKVTKSMAGVVKSMDATLKTMNLEKISALMDKFEHQFETLDVQTQQMEDTMSSTTTLTTPQNQVDMLLQEMADEAGLDLNMELPQGQTGSVGASVASAEQDELSQRLARLRDQVWRLNQIWDFLAVATFWNALCVLERYYTLETLNALDAEMLFT